MSCYIGAENVKDENGNYTGIVKFKENDLITIAPANSHRYWKLVAGQSISTHTVLSEVEVQYGNTWYALTNKPKTQFSLQDGLFAFSSLFDGHLDIDASADHIYAVLGNKISFSFDMGSSVKVTAVRVAPCGGLVHLPTSILVYYTDTTNDWNSENASSWTAVPNLYTGLTSANFTTGAWSTFVTGF